MLASAWCCSVSWYGTIDRHLDHPQMRAWYAFDEGGRSGSGGWQHLRTTWPHSKTEPDQNRAVAMPHGWDLAEVWLLMRDCLAFEDEDQLVLLSGVSPEWFRDSGGITIEGLPTEFGELSLSWRPDDSGAALQLGDRAKPRGGFVLRRPDSEDVLLPVGTRTFRLEFD